MAIPTVGLTGGIASGKSSAARAFAELGIPVCDADQVARQVVQPGSPALNEIFEQFGTEFRLPDGNLDRARMRERVFREPAAKAALEAITHPAIRDQMLTWRAQLADAPYCIFDVAILFEAGFDQWVDRSLVIDAEEADQLARLIARDGGSEDSARRILASQMPRAQRCERATDRIRNQGSLQQLQDCVRQAHHHYLKWVADPQPPSAGFDLPASAASATM